LCEAHFSVALRLPNALEVLFEALHLLFVEGLAL
jgi:hypothetical protein